MVAIGSVKGQQTAGSRTPSVSSPTYYPGPFPLQGSGRGRVVGGETPRPGKKEVEAEIVFAKTTAFFFFFFCFLFPFSPLSLH